MRVLHILLLYNVASQFLGIPTKLSNPKPSPINNTPNKPNEQKQPESKAPPEQKPNPTTPTVESVDTGNSNNNKGLQQEQPSTQTTNDKVSYSTVYEFEDEPNAKKSAKKPGQSTSGKPVVDESLNTLKNAAIGIGIIILIAFIAIFVLRKWKFHSTPEFRQKLSPKTVRTLESDSDFVKNLSS